MPAMSYPFVNCDDPQYVQDNLYLSLNWNNLLRWWTTPVVGLYLPLTMYSYMLDHLLGGIKPAIYHWQSLLWHLLAVVMVYRCLKAGGLAVGYAWFGALLFGIHPQRVESVVWIAERKDVMCAAFYFWSLHAFLIARDPERFNWKVAILLLAALLCKPMAVSLPVLFILIDYARREKFELLRYFRKFTPYFIPAVIVALVTFQIQSSIDSVAADRSRQLAAVLHNLWWYPLRTLYPVGLSPYYPRIVFSVGTVIGLFSAYLAATIILVVAYCRCRRSFFYFRIVPALAAIVVVMLPTVGVVQIGEIDYADRYSYIFSVLLIFYLLFGVQALCRRFRRRWVYGTAVFAGVMILANLHYQPTWCGKLNYWRRAAIPQPANHSAIIMAAFCELENQNYPAVAVLAARLASARESYEAERHPDAGRLQADFLMAEVAFRTGQIAVARNIITARYCRRRPSYLDSNVETFILHRLISFYMWDGNYDRTKFYLRRFFNLCRVNCKEDFSLYYYRGLYYGFNGRIKEAEENFQTALLLQPGDPVVLRCLEHLRQMKARAPQEKK